MKDADQINIVYKKLIERGVNDQAKLVEWILNRYQHLFELSFDEIENKFYDDDRTGTIPFMDGYNQ